MESAMVVVWGLVLIAAGIFLTIYGSSVFRYALAALGFGAGFLIAISLTSGMDTALRVLIAIVAGIVGAVVLYLLVDFSFIIAGAVFGLVVALVLIGILSMFGLGPPGWLVTIIALLGLGLGGYFGRDLGNLIIVLSTTAAGAYLVVSGIHVLYESQIGGDAAAPLEHLAQRFGLLIFVILFVIGYLAQNLLHRRRL